MDILDHNRNNSRFELSVGQLELALFVGVFFAILSYVIWRIKGRSAAYFVSQFVGIAFIILAVGFLFEKVAVARLEHHLRAEHHLSDPLDPNLSRTKPST
jgi:hypothetical protein